MRSVKGSVVAVGVIGLMLVVGSAASAPAAKTSHSHPRPSSPIATQQKAAPATVVKGRKLKSTAISQGFSDAYIPAGLVALDAPTTLNCPGTTTCTFEADQNVTLAGPTANNKWLICTQVDGSSMTEPDCLTPLGKVSSNAFYGSGSFAQSQSGISPGSHTVQTFVYTDFGAFLGTHAIVYHVYTP